MRTGSGRCARIANSRGTYDCLTKAQVANIPTFIYRAE